LIRRQWLFLYPLALSIASTLAFLAIYAAQGEGLSWSAFFTANFDRWQYLREHFLTDFSFTSALWVPIAAGLAFCLLYALIQAPFYRAVAGHRYPLAPHDWREVARLFSFYSFLYLVTRVAWLAGPTEGLLASMLYLAFLVISILVVFTDIVIVFEDVGPIAGLRRSVRLVGHRVIAVLAIVMVLDLVLTGLNSLYGLFYTDGGAVFPLLPISQILVETLVYLFANIILVFLYEEIRRQSPA
jgi:hypothetical protein